MKKYMVYMDDGKDCFKLAIPAKNEEAARDYVSGNGEIIAVKDVTEDYPISADYISKALEKDGFGEFEIDFIIRALTEMNIAN